MRRLSDAIYNVAYNISLIPTEVEVGIKNIKGESKATEKEKQKQRDELDKFIDDIRKKISEERKAIDEARKNVNGGKSPEIITGEESSKKNTDNADEIIKALERRAFNEEVAKVKEEKKLIEKSESEASNVDESKKWFYYALYYITDSNAVKLDDLSNSQKAFVNSITAAFGINVYDDVKPVDIRSYDPSSSLYNEYRRFEIFVESEITPLLNNDEFMKKVTARKEQLYSTKPSEENTESCVVKEEKDLDVIHPISFETLKNPDSAVTFDSKNKAEKLPHKLFKRLENILVPIIGKKNHSYEKNGDLVNLHVYKDGTESTFVLDPGVCMGCGKVFILANTTNDKLFISTEHKDLLRKILSDKSYTLSIEDIRKIAHDYFPDMIVYRYIDMNNTPYIKKLSSEDFIKLGNKLMFAINQEKATNQSGKDLPRLRFNSWESVDKFSLISDKLVKSPLSSTGETSQEIVDGLTISVEGNVFTRVLGDSKYTIEMK